MGRILGLCSFNSNVETEIKYKLLEIDNHVYEKDYKRDEINILVHKLRESEKEIMIFSDENIK